MAKPALKEAKAPQTPDADAAPAAPKKGKKKLLLAAGGLVLLLAGGGAAAWYFLQDKAEPDAAKVAASKPPVFANLEPFTVNLQPDEGDQYLQVAITLKLADAAAVDLVKLHMPEVRNRILLLLSSKRASELVTIEGKQKLSGEVMAQVRQPLAAGGPETAVSGVLFTSFVIQ